MKRLILAGAFLLLAGCGEFPTKLEVQKALNEIQANNLMLAQKVVELDKKVKLLEDKLEMRTKGLANVRK